VIGTRPSMFEAARVYGSLIIGICHAKSNYTRLKSFIWSAIDHVDFLS